MRIAQLAISFLVFGVFLSENLSAQDPMPDSDTKKIVFLSGGKSHSYGSHEHYAGCVLLAKSLEAAMPGYETTVYKHKWPKDEDAFENVDCIVSYCDGGGKHPFNQRMDLIDALAKKGVGIICIHYSVETVKGNEGDKFLEWIGGYFEPHWSVNPHWRAEFNNLPDHPITRGIETFEIQDEWYYHMRFRDDMDGVTPILSAVPPATTLERPDGPHSGNPHVRAKIGQPQHVAWATEREDGGRGFGFTGGHDHWNWGDDNFRRIMLNAIVWTARGEVPEGGVQDEAKDLEELKENQDSKPKSDFDWEAAKSRISPPDSSNN